jgi:predicted Zn-dependent protease with MMP-like domain
MVTIEEAEEILEDVASDLPPEFYKELNGGILLLPDVKKSREPWGESLYVLGEYIVSSSMGKYIAIYYGSFEFVFGNGASRERMAEELRKTLLHEFTHHLEHLAGERDLEKEDERKMRMYREKAALRRVRLRE